MIVRAVPHDTLLVLCGKLPEPVIAADEKGRISLLNAAAAAVLGVSAAEVIGRTPDEHPATVPLAPLFRQVLESGEGTRLALALPSGAAAQVYIIYAPEAPSPPRASGLFDQMREVVHELKMPISSAKSFIDLIDASGEMNEKQAQWARRAQLSLTSMLSLVHELLDMAWLESGQPLAKQQTDLGLLARRAADHYDEYARHRGVEIVLALPEGGCSLVGDERRLEGAIINLISNAIKYSPHGGPVRVVVARENDTAVFQAQDKGIGIAPEHLQHIFEPFYRVRIPATRRIEGSGLGLSIVKAIVERHGGSVFVESIPDQGSTFGFRLPVDGPTD